MPIYEYECAQGHTTERIKSIRVSDEERENDSCEECGQPAVQKTSHTGAPILVGRGFHANDYGAPTKA